MHRFAAPLTAAAIQGLKHDPHVLSIEADGAVSLCEQTNSTGLVRIGGDHFPVAHINGTNEPLDVDVAVIDSGIDPHPDLNVAHFYCPFTNDQTDEIGHGTTVAGIIAASDNDFGVVGIASGVRLWSIKVADLTHNEFVSKVLIAVR